jgi:hypothetical protein
MDVNAICSNFKTKQQPNKKYKEWIKTLGCLICRRPSEPHHQPKKGHGAKGKKTDDLRCLPLCHLHHMELHQQGRETFASKHDLNYEEVIDRLNRAWESL